MKTVAVVWLLVFSLCLVGVISDVVRVSGQRFRQGDILIAFFGAWVGIWGVCLLVVIISGVWALTST